MVPIPYAQRYQTRLKGKVPRLVCCEACGFEYVYLFVQSVVGEGTSLFFLDNQGARERAEERAQALLEEALEQGYEVVPCPECGRIQQHMFSLARRRYRGWMLLAGISLLIGAGILAIPALINTLSDIGLRRFPTSDVMMWVVVAVAGLGGVTVLLLKWLWSRRYDPNSGPAEPRKQEGQKFALSKEKFLKLAQGQTPATDAGTGPDGTQSSPS